MEELNWHREELDGRKQCPSQHRDAWEGDYHPRCRLEVGHALDHAGDGWSWSDDQELKPSRWPKITIEKAALALMISLFLSLVVGAVMIVMGVPNPPAFLWVWTHISSAGLIAVTAIDIKRKR